LQQIDWHRIKTQFPIFQSYPELVYLDSAATSHKPAVVLTAVTDFYSRQNSNVHRGIYDLSELATASYELARVKVANYLGVATREVIFTSGTTASANLVAQSWGAKNVNVGEVILTSLAEHHSNFLPWQLVAQNNNAKLVFTNISSDYDFDYEDFESNLLEFGAKIKVVVLSAVSNVLGYNLDLAKISKAVRTHAPKAKIIIDAAQLVTHSKFTPSLYDLDFAYFSGHKLFAETGIGVLWGKSDLLEQTLPATVGGGMVLSVNREVTTFDEIPQRFEAGTPNIAGAVSLAAAVDYCQELGMDNIEARLHSLTEELVSAMQTIPGLKIYHPEAVSAPVLAFNLEGIHPHDVAGFLNTQHIAVRAGHHCTQILHREILGQTGSVRASLQVYNSAADIAQLARALEDCRNYFSNMK